MCLCHTVLLLPGIVKPLLLAKTLDLLGHLQAINREDIQKSG